MLGIYTFTKRCPVEEFEVRARKTLGYTTVSHYNIVHVECHMAAVRLARARLVTFLLFDFSILSYHICIRITLYTNLI